MSRQKWRKIYFSELQTLHIFHVTSGSVRAKTRGVVKLRKETSGESLNTIILNHFGQALNGESLKEIGRPPSFTSAWFSQTTVLKCITCVILVESQSLHSTVLCKSNASEMREFRSLFLRTLLESSCESLRDNSRLFERNFPTTKSAISSKFLYQTKVRRKFEVKSVVSPTSARNFT